MPKRVDWEAIARAELNPTRLAIIEKYATIEEPLSPILLARFLQVPLANVAYHVDTMRKAGWLRLVRRVPRRGAVEHFYVLAVVRDG